MCYRNYKFFNRIDAGSTLLQTWSFEGGGAERRKLQLPFRLEGEIAASQAHLACTHQQSSPRGNEHEEVREQCYGLNSKLRENSG